MNKELDHGEMSIIKLKLLLEMIVIKVLYMVSVDLMLPNQYVIWSFNKTVDYSYVLVEIIPFMFCYYAYIRNYKRGSQYSFFSTLLFILFYIPTNSGLTLSGNDPVYYCLVNTYSFLIFWLVGNLTNKEERDISKDRFDISSLYDDKRRTRIIRILLYCVCAITIGYVYSYNGLNFSMLFSDMYTTRGEYAAYVSENTDSLLSYFLLVFRKITQWLLPICLYFSLIHKKIVDILLCLFSFLALFTVSMEKSTLMIVGVVVFIYNVEKKKLFQKSSELLIKCFLAMFMICILEFYIKGESIIFNMIVRRTFYMPNWLTKIYYDFYHNNSKMWFTQDVFFIQNITQRIFGRIYPVNSTGVISQAFFDGLIPSPNTGMFAEAYGQLGNLGAFVFPFIVVYIMRIIRKNIDWFGDGMTSVVMTKMCLQLISVSVLPSSNLIGIILVILVTQMIKILYYNNQITVNRNVVQNKIEDKKYG